MVCDIFYCIRGALYLLATDVIAFTYYSDETMASEDKVKIQGLMATVLTVGNDNGSLQGGFTFDALGISWMIIISLEICITGTFLIFIANKKRAEPKLKFLTGH